MAGDWPGIVPFIGPAKNYTRGRAYGAPVIGILHATANTATPTEEAQYAKRANPASAHAYAGDANPNLIQSVPLGDYAWHAGGSFGNRRGVGLEVCGLTKWTRSQWTKDLRDIRGAAQFMRLVYNKTGIRMRHLTRTQFKSLESSPSRSRSGWISHQEYNLWAADAKSDHTDPGPGYPWDIMLNLALNGDNDVTTADVIAGLETPRDMTSSGVARELQAAGWNTKFSTRYMLEVLFARAVSGRSTNEIIDAIDTEIDEESIASMVVSDVLAQLNAQQIAQLIIDNVSHEIATDTVSEIASRLNAASQQLDAG